MLTEKIVPSSLQFCTRANVDFTNCAWFCQVGFYVKAEILENDIEAEYSLLAWTFKRETRGAGWLFL